MVSFLRLSAMASCVMWLWACAICMNTHHRTQRSVSQQCPPDIQHEWQDLRSWSGKIPQPHPCPDDTKDVHTSTRHPLLHAPRGPHGQTDLHLQNRQLLLWCHGDPCTLWQVAISNRCFSPWSPKPRCAGACFRAWSSSRVPPRYRSRPPTDGADQPVSE